MSCGSSLTASGYASPTSSTASFSASRLSGIPFGKMHFRLAKLALSPFGKEVELRNRRLAEKSAIGSEKNGSGSEKSQAIISAIRLNPKVTAAEIAMKLGVSSRAVEKRIKTLRENGVIRRIGGDKGGYWEVIENGTEQ